MNNDVIEFKWPHLQERLNQSFNKYLHIAPETNECKMINPPPLHRTVAGKIKACGNKSIN